MPEEHSRERPPPLDTIAEFVRLQRAMYGWKQATLAAKAGVSLSTVQRVERREAVASASLEKLAVALNQQPRAFTEPRAPLSEEEALALLVDGFSIFEDTVAVPVAPLRTESQLRALTSTMMAITTSDIGEEGEADVDTLREWLGLTSFSRACDGVLLFSKNDRSFSIRKMYGDVLSWVTEMERRHKAVCLAGTYKAQSNIPGDGEIDVAVIAVRSREHNPAAGNIKQLFAPKVADAKAAMRDFFEAVD